MDGEIEILTPEKALVSFRLSSIGSRILAHLLDLTINLSLIIGTIVLLSVTGWITNGTVQMVLIPSCVAFFFAYFFMQEGLWNGQTVGKYANRLRVRMADGSPVTFSAALGRNILRLADFAPAFYFVGMAAIVSTPKSQRLGDLLADTIVVHEPRPNEIKYPPPPHIAGIHPFESQVGTLRGMTIEEYRALRQLCDRFPELPQRIQAKMLDEIWKPISIRRGVPQQDGVSPLLLAEATVMKFGRENGLL